MPTYQYACISGRENTVSRALFSTQLWYAQGFIVLFLCAWGGTLLCWQGRAAWEPVLQSEGGHCWVHISATLKGLGLHVSHTWGLASLASQLPSSLPLWKHCDDRHQVGATCVGTVLKKCLKARTQNIRRNDAGVYFILQHPGCKSINTENTSKCQYLWIKDQVNFLTWLRLGLEL